MKLWNKLTIIKKSTLIGFVFGLILIIPSLFVFISQEIALSLDKLNFVVIFLIPQLLLTGGIYALFTNCKGFTCVYDIYVVAIAITPFFYAGLGLLISYIIKKFKN